MGERPRAVESVGVNQAFWRGRRVFVTGHTGFKGSWLSMWLFRAGADVAGYSLQPPTEPNLFDSARVAELVDHHIGDICDLDGLTQVMKHNDPEIVFHLAAQPLVRASYKDPIRTYTTNVIGTLHVLEAMRSTRARAAVIVTSDKCYENREAARPYRETDRLGGSDPYANSKACAELVTDAYRRSFFSVADSTRVASGRAGNVIGGGDWGQDRLVPDIVRALIAGRPVSIRNPHAIRPWQHVLESLHSYITLAERLCDNDGAQYARGWNFGPADSESKTVQWIVERMVASWGGGAQWVVDKAPQPPESTYLRLDSSEARQKLGIMPRIHLESAIDWTARWYQGYVADARCARELVMNDIMRFEDLA